MELIYFVLHVSFLEGLLNLLLIVMSLKRWSISVGFLMNLLFILTDDMGLHVIRIISLNLATALSGKYLEKCVFHWWHIFR